MIARLFMAYMQPGPGNKDAKSIHGIKLQSGETANYPSTYHHCLYS